MKKLLLFLLSLSPVLAHAAGAGGINITPDPKALLRSTVSVTGSWTFVGTTTFLGPITVPSCTGCGGGPGGGGGGALFIEPYGVTVSSLFLPRGEFGFIDGGSAASTMTVNGTTRTITAPVTFRSSVTFAVPIGSLTVIDMLTAISSVNIMGVITSSSGFQIARGTVTELSVGFGAAGTPSIWLGTDRLTGWYRPSANAWNWTSNGAQTAVMQFTSLGITGGAGSKINGDNGTEISPGIQIGGSGNGFGATNANLDSYWSNGIRGMIRVNRLNPSLFFGNIQSNPFQIADVVIGSVTDNRSKFAVLNLKGQPLLLMGNTSSQINNDVVISSRIIYLDGSISTSAPVDWNTQILNMPAGFADGTDDGGSGGGAIGFRTVFPTNAVINSDGPDCPNPFLISTNSLVPGTTVYAASGTINNFQSLILQVSSWLFVNKDNLGFVGISTVPIMPFVVNPSTYGQRSDLTGAGTPAPAITFFDYIQRQRTANTGFVSGINSGYVFRIRDEAVDANLGFVITNLFNGVLITSNPPTGPINYAAGSSGRVGAFIHNFASMGDHPLGGVLSLNLNRMGNGNNSLTEALRISMTDAATGGIVSNSFGINFDRPTAGAGTEYRGPRGAIHIATLTFTNANTIQLSTPMPIYSDGRNDHSVLAGRLSIGFGQDPKYALSVSTAPNVYAVAITTWNHLSFNGSSPTVTSCGAVPAGALISGTDNAGTIQIGGGVVTSCTLVFDRPFMNLPGNPACSFTTNSTTVFAALGTQSNTQVSASFAATVGGGIMTYSCFGVRE